MSRSLILVLAAIVTIGGLVVVVWAARQILRLSPRRARLLAGIFLLVYGAIVIIRPSAWPVIDLAVLFGAVGAVVLIGGSLSSIGAVVAFLLAAAAVDILSVTGGLSRAIIDGYQEGTSDLLLYLALVVPIDGRIIPVVGISDLFIGGSAAIALIRLGLRPIAVIGAISLGLVGALAYGIWRGGVPALPFIAVAVVLLVWRYSAASTRHVDDVPTPLMGHLHTKLSVDLVRLTLAGPDWRLSIGSKRQWDCRLLGKQLMERCPAAPCLHVRRKHNWSSPPGHFNEYEPEKVSRSSIKRLRGISRPQYRLWVSEIRVFFDVGEESVEILAIVPKSQAGEWVDQFGGE